MTKPLRTSTCIVDVTLGVVFYGEHAVLSPTERDLPSLIDSLMADHRHSHVKAIDKAEKLGLVAVHAFTIESEDPDSPVPTPGAWLIVTTTFQ